MNGRINLFCSLFPVFLLENDYETQIDLGWGGFRAKTAAAVEHLSPSRSLKEEKRERERESRLQDESVKSNQTSLLNVSTQCKTKRKFNDCSEPL